MRYREILPGPGNWKRLQILENGQCSFNDEPNLTGTWSLGHVVTGRSRTFAGFFIQIQAPDGKLYRSESQQSYLAALRETGAQLAQHGWTLNAIGLHRNFYQTGLTDGTDWGYHPAVIGAVTMFSPTPTI